MDSTVTVVTGPSVEPVTIDETRRHCRIDAEDDDILLGGLITAARMWVEMYLSRALITQSLLWTMSERADHGAWPAMPALMQFAPGAIGWPSRLMRPFELPRAPVQSIQSVALRDMDGNDQLLDASTWSADLALQPARLRIRPPLVGCAIRHVQVAFTAGYGDKGCDVPMPIRQAILLLIAFLYENRGDAGGDMPMAAEWLLAPLRIAFFGG